MELSRKEIVDLASRYISAEESLDFPYNGDLFCLLIRAVPTDRVLAEEEGWSFNGYGVCLNYTYDEESRPRGKWLWMHFASLSSFPPVAQVLKLQPPHILKGRFQSIDRTHEIRILKVAVVGNNATHDLPAKKTSPSVKQKKVPADTTGKQAENIVAFRKKKTC